MSNKIDEETASNDERSPLLATAASQGRGDDSPAAPPPPSSSSNEYNDGLVRHRGRLLLFLVSFLYGSLNVSLRLVYARPGPPSASILSATRGWMAVLCLLPVVLVSSSFRTRKSTPNNDLQGSSVSDHRHCSRLSFYGFCGELAISNFGGFGLLTIGLLTTESARGAFFNQLSVVITPILATTIGSCARSSQTKAAVPIRLKAWIACGLSFVGLAVLSLGGSSADDDKDSSSAAVTPTDSIGNHNSSSIFYLSFGDCCCIASAFCWSYYIYRLSDRGDRYDEAQTMLVKNVFLAILYTMWTGASYAWAIHHHEDSGSENEIQIDLDGNENENIDEGFVLWKGWRDPISLSVIFFTALSSGALSDVLQQTGQAHVDAADSNVILSLEPVFAAFLGFLLLHEIPSVQECLGGALIVLASFLAGT